MGTSPTEARDKKSQILIVEDEGLTSNEIPKILERLGYAVAGPARSVERVLEIIADRLPTLALIEVTESGELDAVELGKRIKNDFGIPLLYFTAAKDQPTFERAKRTEPFTYLTKPLAPANLEAAIEATLRNHSLRRQIEDGEARLSAILQSTADAMMLSDAKGRITHFNAAAEELIGVTRNQAVGKSLDEVVHVGDSRHTPDSMLKPRTLVRSDGLRHTVIRTSSPVLGGQAAEPRGTVTILRDVTSLAPSACVRTPDGQAQEEPSHLLVEDVPTGMLMVGRDGRIVLMNSNAEKIFGYARGELIGEPAKKLVPGQFHEDHRDGLMAGPAARAMGSERDLFGVRKDGTEVPIEIGLNPIRSREGQFVLASVVDITERKAIESALHSKNLELAQKNDEMEAFVYNVSHDLRAPLINMQGFVKELELSCRELIARVQETPNIDKRVETIVNRDIPGSLRFITASTDKFQRLIDALVTLSRFGQHEYHFEEVDIQAIVESTLDSLRQSIRESGVSIRLHPLPKAQGDATALGRVFSNLIVNAIKYLQPDRPGTLEIGGQKEDRNVRYWIKDNGRGVPQSAQAQLFQVFRRFHHDAASGEGVGLAIVKRVVDRHGGKIWAESEEGAGTTFWMVLPSAEAQRD